MSTLKTYYDMAKILFHKCLNLGHFIRLAFWYMETTKSYTKTAFEEKAKSFESLDDVNVKEQHFMVTGATSDIGKCVCEYLVKKEGVTLYAVCFGKNATKLLEQSLKSQAKNGTKIICYTLDLSETKEVKRFIDDFIKKGNQLHVFIQCASALDKTLEKNSVGVEKSFAVNVLSTYLFLSSFSEYMRRRPSGNVKSRIIVCVCGDMLAVNIHIGDPELKNTAFKPLYYFSHTKKQMAGLVSIFAEKYHNVQYSAVVPGWVDTQGARDKIPEFVSLARKNLRTPQQGADSVIWLAVSEQALSCKSGEVILDRQEYKYSYLNIPARLKNTASALYIKNVVSILDTSVNEGPTSTPQPQEQHEESNDKKKDSSGQKPETKGSSQEKT